MGIKPSKSRNYTIEKRRGEVIRKERVKRDLTQQDVAEWMKDKYSHLGITIPQPRISKIENGADLNGSELYMFSDCFDLSLETLRCFSASDQ